MSKRRDKGSLCKNKHPTKSNNHFDNTLLTSDGLFFSYLTDRIKSKGKKVELVGHEVLTWPVVFVWGV